MKSRRAENNKHLNVFEVLAELSVACSGMLAEYKYDAMREMWCDAAQCVVGW